MELFGASSGSQTTVFYSKTPHKDPLIYCVNKHLLMTFVALRSSIVLVVDALDKRRIRVNSICIHGRRKPSPDF
jgi:hypothetical protein